jgi:hypothetical protein
VPEHPKIKLCPNQLAFPRDTLVLFVRALDAVFRLSTARKHFNYFVDTPGRISAASWVEKHCIPNIEFVRWHRLPCRNDAARMPNATPIKKLNGLPPSGAVMHSKFLPVERGLIFQ